MVVLIVPSVFLEETEVGTATGLLEHGHLSIALEYGHLSIVI